MQTCPDWLREYPGAVTICDPQGIILYMNERAVTVLAQGDDSLIGQNLLGCHPQPARTKLAELLAAQGTNSYTIEKNGVKKLIHQSPWYQDGVFGGLLELSIEIPREMKHYIRTPK